MQSFTFMFLNFDNSIALPHIAQKNVKKFRNIPGPDFFLTLQKQLIIRKLFLQLCSDNHLVREREATRTIWWWLFMPTFKDRFNTSYSAKTKLMKIRFLTVGNEMESDKLQLKIKPVFSSFFVSEICLRVAKPHSRKSKFSKIFAISSFNDSARFSQNAFSN